MVNVNGRFRRIVLVAICGLWGWVASGQVPHAIEQGSPLPSAPPVAAAPPPACTVQGPIGDWDAAAQLIAGSNNTAYADSFTDEQKQAWAEYSKTAALDWNRLKRRYVDRISAWRAKNLPQSTAVESVFYPFSGPDATNPLAFFPDAREYVLVGLEPAGCVPNSTEAFTPEYWRTLHQAWQSAVSVGFFKTLDMRRDLADSGAGGILPVLLFLIGRAGNRIVDVSQIGIDPTGSLVTFMDSEHVETRGFETKGVEIRFKDDRHGERTLRYFASNLANYRMQQKPGTVKFLDRLAPGGVVVKSASYLMHKRGFSQIRTIALAKANVLIEDDSGIPYSLVDQAVWDVTLFGNYDQPIDLFKDSAQDDLKAAYGARDKVRPLDFAFSYKWRPGESNLLLAIRHGK